MRRGEVWWYEPPHEKSRPVLILTRDDVIGRLRDVVAMPTTGVPRHWLTEVMTELGAERMNEVCRALAVATSC